jgi:acetoin utilization deacetylase AcuC-like enzyme
MAVAMPIVWSDSQRLHEPDGEVWVGVRTPGTELPARAERIRAALEAAGAPIVAAEEAPDEVALRFHDPALIGWLRDAWGLWEEAGLDEDPGQDRVVPYLFAHPGLLGELPAIDPAATTARAGRFAYDTMTLIGPGTWEAARGAVDAAALLR